MSAHDLATAIQELADFARAEDDSASSFLAFQKQLSALERAFALAYESLDRENKTLIREIIHEFQALKEAHFSTEIIAERLASIQLPEEERTTTEELVRLKEPTLTPKVGGKMQVPPAPGPIAQSRPRIEAFVAGGLALIALVLVMIFGIQSLGEGRDEDTPAPSDDAPVTEKEEDLAPLGQGSQTSKPEAKALYRKSARLLPRGHTLVPIQNLRDAPFERFLEGLDIAFSNKTPGIDRIEALLKSAGRKEAAWRESQKENALASFLMTEGNLERYRQSSAILPSEVVAELGGEEWPLAATLTYFAARLGLESVGIARGLNMAAPVLKDDRVFFAGAIEGRSPALASLDELRLALLQALIEREITSLHPKLDALLALGASLLPAERMQVFRASLRAEVVKRLGELSALESDAAFRRFSREDPRKLKDDEVRLIAMAFPEPPPLAWLEALDERDLIVPLSDGRNSLHALAEAKSASDAPNKAAMLELWLRVLRYAPASAPRVVEALGKVGIEEAEEKVYGALILLPHPSEAAIAGYLKTIAAKGDQALLLATILGLVREAAIARKAKGAVIHALAIAISLKNQAACDELLELSAYHWPGDAIFEKLSAEVAFMTKEYAAGRAILRRYLEKWPEDADAKARLVEMRSLRGK